MQFILLNGSTLFFSEMKNNYLDFKIFIRKSFKIVYNVGTCRYIVMKYIHAYHINKTDKIWQHFYLFYCFHTVKLILDCIRKPGFRLKILHVLTI